MVLALLADVAAITLAALFYGLVSLVVLGFTAGLAQCLAKLSLDSTIQRDVPERVQTSAFARSDTTLQLAWVIGGFVGIAMPLQPRLGLIVAAVVLLAWSVFVLANPGRRTSAAVAEPVAEAGDVLGDLAPGQSSSSSASARSSLAVGFAWRESGCRPCR